MKRLAVIGVLLGVALAGVGSAQAQTTIVCEPCSHPYQRWVDEARVPTPELTVTVIETATPCGGDNGRGDIALACTDNQSVIQLAVVPQMRETFLHELGHIWDTTTMQSWQREAFVHLIRAPEKQWSTAVVAAEEAAYGHELFPKMGADEWFADSYAVCARVALIPRHNIYATGDGVTGAPAMRRICRLLRA